MDEVPPCRIALHQDALALLFKHNFPNFARPQANQTHAFMASLSGELFAINKATGKGKKIFQTKNSKANLAELLSPSGGLKYHYSTQGYTHENATKDVERMLGMLDSLVSSTLHEGVVYLGSAVGTVYSVPINE